MMSLCVAGAPNILGESHELPGPVEASLGLVFRENITLCPMIWFAI